MLTVVSIILIIACIILLIAKPANGILLSLIAVPVLGATWEVRAGPFSLNDVLGGMLPLLVLPRLLSRSEFSRIPSQWYTAGLLFLISSGLGIISLAINNEFKGAVELAVHSVNGFIGFFMFVVYFSERAQLKRLLFALVIAGIFPAAVGLYQAATGTVWQTRQTVGITRYVGFYHDAVAIKHYGLQSILATFLLLSQFRVSPKIRTGLFLFGIASFVIVFNAYSKAAITTLSVWLLIWAVAGRQVQLAIGIAVVLIGANLAMGGFLGDRVEALFSKEIRYSNNELRDNRMVFAGRGFIWEAAIKRWSSSDATEQLAGSGKMGVVHNEYLRILICNGLFGLFFFSGSLLLVCGQVLSAFKRRAGPLQLGAVMALAMWGVDSMGTHPGLYSFYMWFVWGIVGLGVTEDVLGQRTPDPVEREWPSAASLPSIKTP